MELNTQPNLDDADAIYAAIIAMHEDLDEKTSQGTNARLVLLLANHIGNTSIITQAIEVAKGKPTMSTKSSRR